MPERTVRTIGATLVLVAVVVVGAIQVGANSGDAPIGTELVESPGPDDSADSGESLPAAEPDPFVYRIGVLSGITTDNYWAYYGEQPSVWNSYILGPTKPALYAVDPTSGAVEPELATSISSPTWDADGWWVTVELDPAFHWSDGRPVTASDFVFTLETVRSLGLQGSWAESFGPTVESARAIGTHTLRIDFGQRPDLSVWPHGAGLAPIMARHVWQDVVDGTTAEQLYDHDGKDDVSGGPLHVVRATEAIVVSKSNAGYPLRTVPDVVEYHVYDDEAALLAALGDGQIDTLLSPDGLTAEQVSSISNPNVSFLTSPANAVRYLGFNLERAPMSQDAFRAALALLVDRDGLASSISEAEAAWTLVPSSNGQWFDTEAAAAIAQPYRRELADRLREALDQLGSAGYTWSVEPSITDRGELVAGQGLRIDSIEPQPLTILTPGDAYDPARPDYVESVAQSLAVLGFDARPVETDFDTVVDLAFTPGADGNLGYDMYVLGWTLGNPALPAFYGPLFGEGGAMNNTGYSNQAFDSALQDYEGAYTTVEARNALRAMEEALAGDLPYLLLYNPSLTEAYRTDRIAFGFGQTLGGLQARLGGITDVRPVD